MEIVLELLDILYCNNYFEFDQYNLSLRAEHMSVYLSQTYQQIGLNVIDQDLQFEVLKNL